MAREDKKLDGAHWRCRTHGVTDEPLLLHTTEGLKSGVRPYCTDPDCNEPLLLVRRALDGKKTTPPEWNRRRVEVRA
jgi:hypothetical protein